MSSSIRSTTSGRLSQKGEDETAVRGFGKCPDCGKTRYRSRKHAKRAARYHSNTQLSAYRCGDYWHLGHLPPVVLRGRSDGPRSRN